MGNCSLRAAGEVQGSPDKSGGSIRVLTDSGVILNFESPKVVGEVVDDFPGYGVFKRVRGSSPMDHRESLLSSQFYYLIPLEGRQEKECKELEEPEDIARPVEEERKIKSPNSSPVENLAKGPGLEVLQGSGNGVWKVKLVIDTKQLEEILAEEMSVEALVQRMREAAASASSINSASNLTPKRVKGNWGVGRKPNLANMFKPGRIR